MLRTGTWQTIFEISSTIGVITNAGLIIFTMTTLEKQGYTMQGKLWIFIGFQVRQIRFRVYVCMSRLHTELPYL
jgi:hypothetical protein